MSCFKFVNLSVNPLHSSKYTQWNEVEARVDDFIQNFFILGAFCSQECWKSLFPRRGTSLKESIRGGTYFLSGGISPVEVYKRVGKSVISTCKGPKMANRSSDLFIFKKTLHLQKLKGMHLLNLVCERGTNLLLLLLLFFFSRRYTKGLSFLSKYCLFPAWKQSFSP